jgi:hypothetical protein
MSTHDFGHPTSRWTRDRAAATAPAEGRARTRVSGEAIRTTLARLGIGGRRVKPWITSPDPASAPKKRAAIG